MALGVGLMGAGEFRECFDSESLSGVGCGVRNLCEGGLDGLGGSVHHHSRRSAGPPFILSLSFSPFSVFSVREYMLTLFSPQNPPPTNPPHALPPAYPVGTRASPTPPLLVPRRACGAVRPAPHAVHGWARPPGKDVGMWVGPSAAAGAVG